METQREIIDRLYETYDNKEYCIELIMEAMNIWHEQQVKNLNIPAVINQVCDKCGDTGNMGNPTLSEPDGQRCDCVKQTCL